MTLYLTKTCFGFVAAKLKASSFMSQKAVISFSQETRCFKFHWTENMFWSFETKLGFFELYITENYIFAFWLLKDVPLRFIAQKDLLWFFWR